MLSDGWCPNGHFRHVTPLCASPPLVFSSLFSNQLQTGGVKNVDVARSAHAFYIHAPGVLMFSGCHRRLWATMGTSEKIEDGSGGGGEEWSDEEHRLGSMVGASRRPYW